MSKQFKTEQGVFLTKSLFFEMVSYAEKPYVVYTLKNEDHQGYPSLRRLYLEEADPTEYDFANKYLAGWDHWKRLCESEWFKPYLESWREELELKLKSQAYKRMMQEAQDNFSKNKLAANKYLIETVRRVQRNEDLGEKNTKGRPDKASVDKKALEMAENSIKVENDLTRLMN